VTVSCVVVFMGLTEIFEREIFIHYRYNTFMEMYVLLLSISKKKINVVVNIHLSFTLCTKKTKKNVLERRRSLFRLFSMRPTCLNVEHSIDHSTFVSL